MTTAQSSPRDREASNSHPRELSQSLQVGQQLVQRYELVEPLANHDNRQTWIALDQEQSPPQQVVVKCLTVNSSEHWQSLKLFERESQVLQALDHPQIPDYLDFFELEEGFGFGLVQEYIPGKSLKQLLNEGNHFEREQVQKIAQSLLKILIYLHELSPPVLHRDIKPSNIVLDEDERLYLVDFGAVQTQGATEGQTFTVVGTYGYAPMEQYGGRAIAASDLYSLGATLIHLLTGVAPINLSQDENGFNFAAQTNVEQPFVNWLVKLAHPQLRKRFSSANEALETLETGIPSDSLATVDSRTAQSQALVNPSDWQLPAGLARHSGALVTDDMRFFVEPPPEIGEIITADSTLSMSDEPTKLSTALIWAATFCIALFGLTWLILAIFSISGFFAYFVKGSVLLIDAFFMLCAFFSATTSGECSFVGDRGLAEMEFKQSEGKDPIIKLKKMIRFEEMEALTTHSEHHVSDGKYAHTQYCYAWSGPNRRRYTIKGVHHSQDNVPDPSDDWHFANAAEQAWLSYLLPKVYEAIHQKGYVEFPVPAAKPKQGRLTDRAFTEKISAIRIGKGYVGILSSQDSERRINAKNLQVLGSPQGTCRWQANEVKWHSKKGRYYFSYEDMPNSTVFLHCLREIAEIEPD